MKSSEKRQQSKSENKISQQNLLGTYPQIITRNQQRRLRFQPLYLQPIITQYFIDNKSEIWLLFLIAHSKR